MNDWRPSAVVLRHNGQVLDPTHTPHSLGAPADSVLRLQMMQ